MVKRHNHTAYTLIAVDIKQTDMLPRPITRRASAKKNTASSAPLFSTFQHNSIDQGPLSAPSGFTSFTLDYLSNLPTDHYEAQEKAVTYGQKMIHELETLQERLLKGNVSKTQLTDLKHLLQKQSIQGLDDRLKAIIDDIRIRAEVELAKLDTPS